MNIYRYVSWKLETDNLELKYIFGNTKIRKMKKGFGELTNNGFNAGIEKLNENILQEFNDLYMIEISKKTNAKIHNIIERYGKKLDIKDSIFLSYIRKNNKLIGGCIFEYTKNMDKLKMIYKASDNIIISGVGLGLYIDHIIFEDAINRGVNILSRGKDRNAYGLIGSNPGLVIQKLQTRFMPYVSTNDEVLEIDENNINQETLLFCDPDQKKIFRKAILWTNKNIDDVDKDFGIITKMGIDLEVKSLK